MDEKLRCDYLWQHLLFNTFREEDVERWVTENDWDEGKRRNNQWRYVYFVCFKKCIFEATVTQENNRDGFPRDHQGMNQDLKEIIENPLLLMPRSYRRFYDHLSDLKS